MSEQINNSNHKQESLIEIDRDYTSNTDKDKKPKKETLAYLKKIQDKIKDFNVPHHIKIDTIFDTVKDAHTIFAIERKTYDFVINLNKLLIVIICLLIILLIALFPLKEKEPYLVGFSNATQNFVHIEKANESITANDALLRKLIGSYIINRETINHFDDEERFETIRFQSSYKVWKTFENIVAQQDSIYGNSNLTREIKVINIAKFKNGYANAEVSISLYALGVLQSQKRYRITLTYKFNTLDIDFESLPKNPTGFEVQEYAVTEIATIKELDEENKVNPAKSESKIKVNQPQTDSNEFLREAYQFQKKKELERQQEQIAEQQKEQEQIKRLSDEEYMKLNQSEQKKALSEELKEIKKRQEKEEKQRIKELEQSKSTQPTNHSTGANPFVD